MSKELPLTHQGRRFRGFRKIIVDDLQNSMRSATTYHQKWPLTSLPECAVTAPIADGLAAVACGSTQALSQASSTYTCNGSACPAAPATNTIYRIDPAQSQQVTRDVAQRSQRIIESSGTQMFDAYGNLTAKTQTVIDYQNNSEVRRTQSDEAHTYSVNTDPSTWWLNQLSRSRVSVSQSYGAGHSPPAGSGLSVGAPITRTTTTVLGWDALSRQSDCTALLTGDAPSTLTCAGAAPGNPIQFEHKSTRSFDGWGNLAQATTTARQLSNIEHPLNNSGTPPIANARVSQSSYANSSGYFPNVATDAYGKQSTTLFDARFGAPLSVTDANGLTSSMAYDGLGRAIRSTPASAGGAVLAPVAVSAYEDCNAGRCAGISGAQMRVVSAQAGAPRSISFIDALGRTLQTSTQMQGSGWSQVAMQYNARGLMAQQSEPTPALSETGSAFTGAAVTLFDYDVLGRMIAKSQYLPRLDQNVLSASGQFRVTRYSYSGLSTTIDVCLQPIAHTACSGNANSDGSPVLRMQRAYDSAQRLLWTLDAEQMSEANGKKTRFFYDGAGNALAIEDVKGLLTKANYNDVGHRISVTDPSRGTWAFAYNGLGELLTQTDARGYTATLAYDSVGRQIQRSTMNARRTDASTTSIIEQQRYDVNSSTRYGVMLSSTRSTPSEPGLVSGARNPNFESVLRTYDYDALNRATQSTLTIDPNVTGLTPITLTSKQTFDQRYGRVKQSELPGSISSYLRYAPTGHLVREGFAEDYSTSTPDASSAYRVLSTTNARGQAVDIRYGERAGQTDAYAHNAYDDASGWMLAQCVGMGANPSCAEGSWPSSASTQVMDQRYRYDGYGNLIKLGHAGVWATPSPIVATESFVYDRLHRLTTSSRNTAGTPASETVNYRYDVIGHLLAKGDWSSSAPISCTATATSTCPYQYAAGSHRIAAVTLAAGGTASYTHDANGNITQRSGTSDAATIQYDADNLPQRMVAGERISDFYSIGGARYRHLGRNASSTVLRDTLYLDKAYERETAGAQTTERYYLTEGVLLTVKNGTRELNYLHSDRLGSPISITGKNTSGQMQLKEHRGFDPFGKARDGQGGNSTLGKLYALTTVPYHTAKTNQRGFTQHEHLDEFALIHMNGRLYDYNLGRFYGVDPIIQFPANSQSINPYSYLGNNPLSGTDPTGYAGSCPDKDDRGSCVYAKNDREQIPFSRLFRTVSIGNGAQDKQGPSNTGDTAKKSTDVGDLKKESNSQPVTPAESSVGCASKQGACHPIDNGAVEFPLPTKEKALEVALGFTGVGGTLISLYELKNGKSPLSGDEASRVWAAVGIIPFLKLLRHADEAVDAVRFIDPSAVRFSQDSVGATFRDGRSVNDLANALRGPSGSDLASNMPPIRLFFNDGILHSLDNRRLLAFSSAGVKVPYRIATLDELAKELGSKMTTTDVQRWGEFIEVRLPKGGGR